MTGTTTESQHEKKNDRRRRRLLLENDDDDDDDFVAVNDLTYHDLQALAFAFLEEEEEEEEESSASSSSYSGPPLRNSAASDVGGGGGIDHGKKSEERDAEDDAKLPPPKVFQAPPAPEPLDPAGLRDNNGVSSSSATNAGSYHAKSSTEQDRYHHENVSPDENDGGTAAAGIGGGDIQFHDLEGPGNGLRGDDTPNLPEADTEAYHDKSSFFNLPSVPTPKPTPAPAVSVFESLRDVVHQSSSSNNNNNTASEHQKNSIEKNAQNPNQKPEIWDPLAGFFSPTGRPTIDLRRVNPAPEIIGGDGDGDGDQEECRATRDGRYFGKGQGDARNAGVVLRYRYELHENGANDGGNLVIGGGEEDDETRSSSARHTFLARDILPKLEAGITDTALIPAFFEECSMNRPRAGDDEAGTRSLRRTTTPSTTVRGLATREVVVGIDARPEDFALEQQACESTFTADSYPDTECHRIEGALTLYFPPNSPVDTSALSSATLTTLRAIERGMDDGSLLPSHRAIRKLHFARSSYDLHPGLGKSSPYKVDWGEQASSSGARHDTTKGGNLGLILGIVMPLLLVGFCCCVCLGLRRRRLVEEEEEGDSSHGGVAMRDAKGGSEDDDDYTETGTDCYPDEDSYSGTEYDEEEDQGAEYEYEEEEERADYSSGTAEYEEEDEDGGSAARGREGAFGPQTDREGEGEYDDDRGSTASDEESYDEISDEDDEDGTASRGHERPDGDEDEPDYSEEEGDGEERRFSAPVDSEEEEESTEFRASPSAAFNPLNSVFEEAEREREKKAKMKRRRNRVRKRMERMRREEEEEAAAFSSDGKSFEGMDREEEDALGGFD